MRYVFKIAKLADDPRRDWSAHQCRDFCDRAASPWGDGWKLLGREMREALIGAMALSVAVHQSRESLNRHALECLWLDMMITAGLRSEDEITRPDEADIKMTGRDPWWDQACDRGHDRVIPLRRSCSACVREGK